jgi:uncharacterized membrane protein YkvA (DUF1232 family)
MRLVRRIWTGASRGERLVLLAALAYLLWPLDVVPEALFGLLGLTDDLAAAGVLLAVARRALRRGGGG